MWMTCLRHMPSHLIGTNSKRWRRYIISNTQPRRWTINTVGYMLSQWNQQSKSFVNSEHIKLHSVNRILPNSIDIICFVFFLAIFGFRPHTPNSLDSQTEFCRIFLNPSHCERAKFLPTFNELQQILDAKVQFKKRFSNRSTVSNIIENAYRMSTDIELPNHLIEVFWIFFLSFLNSI